MLASLLGFTLSGVTDPDVLRQAVALAVQQLAKAEADAARARATIRAVLPQARAAGVRPGELARILGTSNRYVHLILQGKR